MFQVVFWKMEHFNWLSRMEGASALVPGRGETGTEQEVFPLCQTTHA